MEKYNTCSGQWPNDVGGANEDHMASRIQRVWRGYIKERKETVKRGKDLARILCDTITDKPTFDLMINDHNQVVVVLNGDYDDPEDGHSVFFTKGKRYELSALSSDAIKERRDRGEPIDSISRYSFISYAKKETFSIITNHVPIRWKSLGDALDVHFDSKYLHLVKKYNVMFSLKEKYIKYFEQAFAHECEVFKNQPYSYGLGYNCNTFTTNVLTKILRLSLKNL